MNLVLENVLDVSLLKVGAFGIMVKIECSKFTIYLCVPRIFLNIGTGFVVVNYFATLRLKKLLEID